MHGILCNSILSSARTPAVFLCNIRYVPNAFLASVELSFVESYKIPKIECMHLLHAMRGRCVYAMVVRQSLQLEIAIYRLGRVQLNLDRSTSDCLMPLKDRGNAGHS